MTRDEFRCQMDRMADRFKNIYSDEVRKLIWREVGECSYPWWVHTVDYFIGSSRQPPLMPEILEQRARYREQQWSIQKSQHKQDAEEFMSVYGSGEIKIICQSIIKRLGGGISDNDWECQLKLLNSVPIATEKKTDTNAQHVKTG